MSLANGKKKENNMNLTGKCICCGKELFVDGICVECYNKNKKGA